MDMDMDMEAIKMLSPNRTEADQANQSRFNCISKCSCKIKQKRSSSNSSLERKKKVIGAGCWRSSGNLAQLPFFVTALCMLIFELSLVPPIRSMSSPNETAWPPMRHYDIWGDDTAQPDNRQEDMLAEEVDLQRQLELNMDENMEMDEGSFPKETISQNETNSRQGKVIHLFPVPVDGDCLSNDGRRMGNCLNAYECRQKDGQARGECAMGFGVCCVFVANCNTTISNNITYIVSPGFPSFMPSNFSGCNLRVKMMTDDISQVRIDFHHFTLGQPNRRTGVCDGDAFQIGGGPGGNISLCGQNSGQHLYYDVGARATPRQSTLYGSLRPLNGSSNSSNSSSTGDRFINIDLNLANRFLPLRIWEISVVQIPFSQRAPAGCLQYHTGTEGLLQTFNFAENGRHLANQNYRICMRQELDMCSIVYQPCDQQSFRIGGGGRMATRGGDSDQGAGSPPAQSDMAGVAATAGNVATTTPVPTSSTLMQMLANMANSTTTTLMSMMSGNSTTASNSNSSAATGSTAAMSTASATTTTTTSTTPTPLRSSTVASTSTSSEAPASSPASDDVEGSGGEVGEGSDDDDDGGFLFFRSPPTTEEPGFSRRPRPVGGGSSGGFDILGFLRNAFDLQLRRRRQARQFFSTCTDRITMPCIIEDFIGTGLGPLPGCEPIHCGSQFCSSGTWPCRIESTVTPFYIGVHFGNGMGAGKANAEDNVGACLRYSQVQCM